MADLQFFEVFIVIALAVIQSVAGVGILLVGTPILIIMGYEFLDILSVLVLPSFVVSTINIVKNFKSLCFDFELLYLPVGVFAGLYMTHYFSAEVLFYLSGALLVILGAMALRSESEQGFVFNLSKKLAHKTVFYPVLSLVHGFSNLGGGFLVWRSTEIYADKYKIRAMTALAYAVLAASQLVSMKIIFGRDLPVSGELFLPILAGGVFVVSDKFFPKIENQGYRRLMYYFLIFLGCLILTRVWWNL